MFGGIDGESLVQVYNESVDFMYKDQARCLAAFGGHFGYDDRRQRTIFSGTTRSGHTKPANLWIRNCPYCSDADNGTRVAGGGPAHQ